MKTKALILMAALLMAAIPAFAAFDAYLQIDGIKGESQEDHHKDWIAASSFSWGVLPPSPVAGAPTAAAASRCSVHEFTITKPVDTSSPKLQQMAMGGAPIPKLMLEVRGERHLLQNVVIKSIRPTQMAMGDGSVRPAQAITFGFANCATHANEDGGISYYYKHTDHGHTLKVDQKGTSNGLFSLGGGPQGAIILQDVVLTGNNSAIITVGHGDQMLLPAVQRAFQSKQRLPGLTLSARPSGGTGSVGKVEYLKFDFHDVIISSVAGNQFTVHFGRYDGPMAGFHDVEIK